MPQQKSIYTGLVTSWDLPNFVGELWNADVVPGESVTPTFLAMIGGMNGGRSRIVGDINYNMTVEFDFPAPEQPNISELASATGVPQPVNPLYTSTENTVQIYQESVEETYVDMATRGRFYTEDIASYGPDQNDFGVMSQFAPKHNASALDRQIAFALKRIARNMNHTFLNGIYEKSTGKNVAPRTKGLLTGIETNAIDAKGAALSDTLVNQLILEMQLNSGGNAFSYTPLLVMNAYQKQRFSALYAYPPTSRTVAGFNIQTFETDFGTVGVLYEPTIPSDTILFTSLSLILPTFLEVPGKGYLFYEPKSKVAASEGGMLFGMAGIDYGPEWMHGKITGLAVSH